jgi:hypothetical protein
MGGGGGGGVPPPPHGPEKPIFFTDHAVYQNPTTHTDNAERQTEFNSSVLIPTDLSLKQ